MITSPNDFFVRSFVHSDVTVGTTAAQALAAVAPEKRRIHLIVQNQDSNAVVEIILNNSGSEGIEIAAGASFTMTGYNGEIRLKSDTPSTPVHIAYAIA